MCGYGEGGDDIGCVQCGGGTATTGDIELPGAAGTAGGGDSGFDEDGAAVGVEAFAGAARGGVGTCSAGRAADAVPDECGGDTAAA